MMATNSLGPLELSLSNTRLKKCSNRSSHPTWPRRSLQNPFFVITAFLVVLVSCVSASPLSIPAKDTNTTFARKVNVNVTVPSYENHLETRAGKVLLGYRYVQKKKADDYMKAGGITAIPATKASVGEGVYLSPQLRDFVGKETLSAEYTHEVSVYVDPEIFKRAKTLYITDRNAMKSKSPVKLDQLLAKYGMKRENTILFADYWGGYMVFIPPYYLLESVMFKEDALKKGMKAGGNRLGLEIKIYERGKTPKSEDHVADWSILGIKNYPSRGITIRPGRLDIDKPDQKDLNKATLAAQLEAAKVKKAEKKAEKKKADKQ